MAINFGCCRFGMVTVAVVAWTAVTRKASDTDGDEIPATNRTMDIRVLEHFLMVS